MSHAYKKVTPKEPLKRGNRSAVEMVTKYGDLWSTMGGVYGLEWAYCKSLQTERSHDTMDYVLMRQMERGERARVEE